MYCLINQDRQIVAMSQSLMRQFGIENIAQLYEKIGQGEMWLEHTDFEVIIYDQHNRYRFDLSSLDDPIVGLGQEWFAVLAEEVVSKSEVDHADVSALDEALLQPDDDTFLGIEEPSEKLLQEDAQSLDVELEDTQTQTPNEVEIPEDLLLVSEDADDSKTELAAIDSDLNVEESAEEEKEVSSLEHSDTQISEEVEIPEDLLLPSDEKHDGSLELLQDEAASQSTSEPLTIQEDTKEADDTRVTLEIEDQTVAVDEIKELDEIFVDIAAVAQTIGISQEEYRDYLDEFVELSLELEPELYANDPQRRAEAIDTLAFSSDFLRLPVIHDMVKELVKASPDEQLGLIERFYQALSKIVTVHDDAPQDLKGTETSSQVTQVDLPQETPQDSSQQVFSINLDEVEPIHFDFRLEDAAQELSLPVDLIDEFVMDFIKQARSETPKMLEAYDKGDLQKVQKIGHLLKGAASNLRITPLAERLYDIQFCDDLGKMEPLIKQYWAYFLSFEKHMELLHKS